MKGGVPLKWRRNMPYPRPKKGDKRTRIKFAWLPTQIGSDQTVWLENYLIEEFWCVDGQQRVLKPSGLVIYQGDGWRIERVFAQGKN